MPDIPKTPRSTYRLQFHKDFNFRHAREIVDYLADLGISHLYASPILTARPGSTHGYDIVNHNQLNPELGAKEDFDALVAALHAKGMGMILDIVPNHMGVGGKDNAWWLDVLEWGEDSPYAPFFDIDWKTSRRGLKGKVLLPVLGDQYGKVLAAGEIKLAFDPEQGTFSAWYYVHCFPIDPRDYPRIVAAARGEAGSAAELTEAFRALKSASPEDAYREAKALKQKLAALAREDGQAVERLSAAADALNGTAGDLDSWMKLHELLEAQSYRAAYWRVAADEINYRRFFNINDLAGVRVELRELFEESHRLIFRMVEDGQVNGLRIDHIDGLFNPKEYCERVQARAGRPGEPAYVVVEKILAPHERLPEDWPIAGTSGYDTLNVVNGVFVDPSGEGRLDRFYRRYTGRNQSFDDVLYESKKRIMQVNLASEMNVLANELHRLSNSWLPTRDFTLRGIRDALEEVLAYFPVYRSYVTPDGLSEQDRRHIEWAVAQAKKRSTAADVTVFDFMQSVLTGDVATGGSGYRPEEVFRVAMKAQQISGPVMAKGMEDTAFYRYFRLISLNEVGGEPRRFGISLAAFHRINRDRLEKWPLDMLASSTHDTKRGEDARARINVLSEIPGEWGRRVLAWSRLNRSRRSELDGAQAPDANHEYLFYQTLLGAWPNECAPDDPDAMRAFAERVDAFMQKAVREGKERSGWTNPNQPYEEAVSRFVHGALEVSSTNPFPADFATFVERVARLGAINSLGQTLLKLTMPGVPDTYRGSDLWDLSLVDPDNRRPVDYDLRRRLLAEIPQPSLEQGEPAPLSDLRENWRDGREKLFLIRCVLTLRQRHPDLFAKGEYLPLMATGERSDHICAFARAHGAVRIVVAAPRFPAKLSAGSDSDEAPDWTDTAVPVPAGSYRNLFTGKRVDVADQLAAKEIFEAFPIALLLSL